MRAFYLGGTRSKLRLETLNLTRPFRPLWLRLLLASSQPSNLQAARLCPPACQSRDGVALAFACGAFFDREVRVVVNHDSDEFPEPNSRLPAKLQPGLGAVANQQIDLCWPEVPWIDFYVFAPVKVQVAECFV